MANGYNVAVAGATGAVGVEMIKTLEKRNFPVRNLKLLASARSAGKTLKFKGEDVTIEEMTEASFRGVDIALFSAGGDISRAFRPAVVSAGAVMIDNSSAFRMDEDVPLVVPEVNPEDIKWNKGVIANPNCTTAIMLVAVAPLHRAKKLRRLVAATYQAAMRTTDLTSAIVSWSPANAMTYVQRFHSDRRNQTPACLTDENMDAMVEEMNVTMDDATRSEMITDIIAYANEICPFVPIYQVNYYRAYNSALQNVVCSATGYVDFCTMSWS